MESHPHPCTAAAITQALGGLLLALACASQVAMGHMPSMDLLANTGMGGAGPGGRYSPELVRLLGALLASGGMHG